MYEQTGWGLPIASPEQVYRQALREGRIPRQPAARSGRAPAYALASIPGSVAVVDRPRVTPTTTRTAEQVLKPGEGWVLERWPGEVDAGLELDCRNVAHVCARDLLMPRAPEVRFFSAPTAIEWASRQLAPDGVPVIAGQRCRRVAKTIRGFVESTDPGSVWIRYDGRDKWGLLGTLVHETRHCWQLRTLGRFDEPDAAAFASEWVRGVWGDDAGRFRFPDRRGCWRQLLK